MDIKKIKINLELTPKEFWALTQSVHKHGGRATIKRFLGYTIGDEIRKTIFKGLEKVIGPEEMDKLDTEWKSCVIEQPPPKPKPPKKQPLPRGVWRNF